MGDNRDMRKGAELRETRLSVRVPLALKRAIVLEAQRDRRTVADVVIFALEATFLRARGHKRAVGRARRDNA